MPDDRDSPTSPSFHLRAATPRDASALVPLFEAFLEEQFALSPFAKPNPAFQALPYLVARLRDPARFTLVATRDNAIVAFGEGAIHTANPDKPALAWNGVRPLLRSLLARASARATPTYLAPRRVGIISTVFVAPDARGARIGPRLTHALADELRRRDAEVIYTHVLANNPARAMYEACGMQVESVQLRWPSP